MEGIGERFGSSFDDIRRDPRPVVVALAFDACALAAIVAVLVVTGDGPASASFLRFAVPGPLPTSTDILHVPSMLVQAAGAVEGVWAAAAVALALAPAAAWFEGGMVGVLKAAYVDRDPGPLAPRFLAAATKAFRPLLAYRILLHAALVAGFVVARVLTGYRGEVVGAIVLEFLLLFVPFLVVLEGESAWGAMKRSAGIVADHLASCLILLLFGLLVTGGAAALVRGLGDVLGPWTLPAAALLWAPFGTALALFELKVFLSFRPQDVEPAKATPSATTA